MFFLSQQEHVSDGTLRVVPFSIAFLDVADLHFYIGSDEVTSTVPVGGVLVQQITQYQVSLTAPVPAGVVFSVRRVTPRTSVPHIFNNGAALFNAANTDENNTYAMFIVQEVYEQSGLGPFPGITTIDGTELLYVTVGGVRKQLTLATLLEQAPEVVLDTFKADLANQTDPLKGAGLVGVVTPAGDKTQADVNDFFGVSLHKYLTDVQIADSKLATPVLDLTSTIQDAIDDICPFDWKGGTRATELASRPGRMFVPIGTYNYTKLRIPPNFTFIGECHGDFFSQAGSGSLRMGSCLKCTLSDYTQYSIDTSPFNASGVRVDNTVLRGDDSSNGVATFVENVVFENLHIKGGNTCKGINIAGAVQFLMKNCYVSGFTIPLRLSASWFGSIEDSVLEGSYRGLMTWQDVTTLELRNVSIEKQGSYNPNANDADLMAPEQGAWYDSRNKIACGIYNYYGCIHGTATIQLWPTMLTTISGRDDLAVYIEGITQTIINAVGADNQTLRVRFQQIAKCETAKMLWAQYARVHIESNSQNYTASQFDKLIEYCDSNDNYDFIPRFDGLDIKSSGDPYYSTGIFKRLNTKPTYHSFTPIVRGDGTAGSCTYTKQVGRATKVGDVVTFTCEVSWSGHTGSGILQVAGLPFPNGAITSVVNVGMYGTTMADIDGSPQGLIPVNAVYVNVAATTKTGALNYTTLPSSGNITVSGSFII